MRTGLLAIAALSCAACSTGSLFDSDVPVPTSYVIASAPPGSVTGAPTTQVDVSIGRPDFGPGLDTDRIAVLKGRQLDYYRGVRWGGRTVEIVQSMLVSSINDQQLFRSVTAEQARVANDYMLDVEVRNFESDYANGAIPEAHVMIIGRLVRVVDRKLVTTVTSTARVAAREESMTAVAAAFESAAQKVALDLAQQTATAIAGDQPTLRKARGESDQARPE
ncbi:MAG: ABC-type transport auxiliary lipoprotein family protein [Pseudomonadota bacterium]|nr:ABC-type transport auxiliary lipoprotein family protein [Pseudomonadota bacterium]